MHLSRLLPFLLIGVYFPPPAFLKDSPTARQFNKWNAVTECQIQTPRKHHVLMIFMKLCCNAGHSILMIGPLSTTSLTSLRTGRFKLRVSILPMVLNRFKPTHKEAIIEATCVCIRLDLNCISLNPLSLISIRFPVLIHTVRPLPTLIQNFHGPWSHLNVAFDWYVENLTLPTVLPVSLSQLSIYRFWIHWSSNCPISSYLYISFVFFFLRLK